MASEEFARQELYARLEQALGTEPAMALMHYLPPEGEVAAVRAAIEGFRTEFNYRLDRVDDRLDRVDDRLGRIDDRLDRIDGRLDRHDDRFDGIYAAMISQNRLYIFATLGSLATFASVVVAAIRL